MHVEAGMTVEPAGDRGMFMGGVIVGDDMDVEIGRVSASMVLRKASHS